MKKIGYIYKYSIEENKGILVYGQWCSQSHIEFSCQHLRLIDKPIKFTSSDCKDNVRTGDLVYFYFENGVGSEIERASLLNFDKELLTIYLQIGFITYEQIYDADSDRIKDGILTILGKYISDKNDLHTAGDNKKRWEYLDLVNRKFIRKKDFPLDYYFPNNIDELYECFGKYGHEERYDSVKSKRKIKWPRRDRQNSVIVDIFDLALWIDEVSISQNNYYGKTLEEIKSLYDLFVQKERLEGRGTKINPEKVIVEISPAWTLLLAKLSNDDLRKILEMAPVLQPRLPIEFCKDNLEILDDKYGMPNVDLCRKYCVAKINNASTATEYREWSRKLNTFATCNSIHSPKEGTPMCAMGKEYINGLVEILEKNFENQIEPKIVSRINDFLGLSSHDSINSLTKTEILSMGVFVDDLYAFRILSSRYRASSIWSYRFEKIVKSYDSIDKKLQELLLGAWINFVNDSLLELSAKEAVSPLSLGSSIELVKDYVRDDTKSIIMTNVNDRFSMLSDFSDLKYAFEYDFISESQYSNNSTFAKRKLRVMRL